MLQWEESLLSVVHCAGKCQVTSCTCPDGESSAVSHPLLLTKLLAPSPRAGIVVRQALVNRLNLDLNRRSP